MTGGPEATVARLEEIRVYPLKSASGISLAETEVSLLGLPHDRGWMLVDADGGFLSLRTHPRMAFLRTALTDATLRLEAPGAEPIELPLEPPAEGGPVTRVRVWREDRFAVDCGDEAAAWASDFLGTDCRVVRAVAPEEGPSLTEDAWVRAGFADAQPALVVSTGSLDELNRRLDAPIPMSRFRPNLVVSGVPAHHEDTWSEVRIGSVRVRLLRPCPRCAATTVDADTATKGKEPLRTLATYRRGEDGEVYFGMNARFDSTGTLRVGDAVATA